MSLELRGRGSWQLGEGTSPTSLAAASAGLRDLPYAVFSQKDSGSPNSHASTRFLVQTRDALGRQLLSILDLASATAIRHYCCAGCAWLPPCPLRPRQRQLPQRKKRPEVAAASCWWNEVEPTNDLGECDRSSHSVLNYRSKKLGTSPKSSSASPSALMEQKAMFLKQSQGNPSPSPSLVFQTYKGGEGGPSDSSLAHEGREWCPLLSATFKWGRLEEPRLSTSKRGKKP